MKKNVSKLLFAIVCLLSSTSMSAYDFEVDGIYYDVVSMSDLTCKVVNANGDWNTSTYTGNITIPATFKLGGTIWTVIEIADQAFYSCKDLTSVTISNSVTQIGAYAFMECSSLTSITIPNSVSTIDAHAFDGCNSLTSVTLSNSVTAISGAAFDGCSSLTSVTIPNSVTQIEAYAFRNCSSLTSIILGNSVNRISDRAFFNCNALTTLYSLNTTPPNVDANNFTYNQFMDVNVYVPQKALTAYRNAEPWNGFKNLQSIEGTGSETEKCATPIIRYANNTLTFECETEGVTFESKITDTDITSYSSSEIQLGVTYNISVYATKTGYEDSDMATATLCWIDVEPKIDGIDSNVAQVRANAVLIQSANGQINVTGLDDGTKVAVYGIEGTQIGSAISRGGQTSINANITSGSVAIVKIGDRNIKVVMK